jgi:hypothetical protein
MGKIQMMHGYYTILLKLECVRISVGWLLTFLKNLQIQFLKITCIKGRRDPF